VCGGPPCQGYSGIGHRRTFKLDKNEIPSNFLYKEMSRIIRFVNPKIFLFENVKGLTNSRWTKNGRKGEVFYDVLKELWDIPGYNVRWQQVEARNYGVPQNRPRILVVGLRSDVASGVSQVIFNSMDIPNPTAIIDGFLPKGINIPPHPEELFSDLVDSRYPRVRATKKYLCDPQSSFQRMLRTSRDERVMGKGDLLTEQDYSNHSRRIRDKFKHMILNNGEIPLKYKTKKFAQRVIPRQWGPGGPNITATSLADDYVHYEQARSLTVREWARLQTFPDWYVFMGSRTTGGRRRAGDPDKGIWDRDVPKYTQIGNAVPVLLAKVVGLHFSNILDLYPQARLINARLGVDI
jgi:DNA (cytosine-5)-methyltransferase 1